jgi:ribonuclease T1
MAKGHTMAGLTRRVMFLICLLTAFAGFVQADLCGAWHEGPLAYSKGQSEALAKIPLADLPREAKHTLTLIKQGGPFPYPKDGTIFSNREGRLPHRHRGYYREYTVKTLGIRHRGARRIVAGSGGEFYYTGDHYNTFQLIKE